MKFEGFLDFLGVNHDAKKKEVKRVWDGKSLHFRRDARRNFARAVNYYFDENNSVQKVIRIKPGLVEKIERMAKKNKRSFNSEVAFILEGVK